MAELYPAHLVEVARRTAVALAATGYEGLLVHSGVPPTLFLDDQDYPFKVQAPFKVWSPLTGVPDCFVYFTPGPQPLLLFHQPVDYWFKPAAVPDAYWVREFDVRVVATREAARKALPRDLRHVAFIGEPFPELQTFGVGAINPQPLIARLDYPRARKTPFELESLREASRIGARGHAAAVAAFYDGASELGIELAFLQATGLREQELPYNPIIALNADGAVLHYQLLKREPPPERHSLLIDAGAEMAGYASDITRTYAYRDSDFADLIGQLDAVQQALCHRVRAGVDWRDLHVAAHRLIAGVLRDVDIIRADVDAAIDTGITAVFFPHGLGHLLGLQVHDVAGRARGPEGGEIPRPDGHAYLRLTRTLEPGFVVTVEPGVYFIDQLLAAAREDARGRAINWTRVDQLRKFGGIRIEDNVVALEKGCENLTRDAFRALSS
jgi:Xaa-Pro dipeptidase